MLAWTKNVTVAVTISLGLLGSLTLTGCARSSLDSPIPSASGTESPVVTTDEGAADAMNPKALEAELDRLEHEIRTPPSVADRVHRNPDPKVGIPHDMVRDQPQHSEPGERK
jgi:hypothetical protein